MELLERTDDLGRLETGTGRSALAVQGVAAIAQHRVVSISSAEAIEETDGVWTVRDLETGIFGSGDSELEALRDFRVALDEHRDVLERQPVLSDDLAAQLAYLRFRLG
jgi:hypothetical protein